MMQQFDMQHSLSPINKGVVDKVAGIDAAECRAFAYSNQCVTVQYSGHSRVRHSKIPIWVQGQSAFPNLAPCRGTLESSPLCGH